MTLSITTKGKQTFTTDAIPLTGGAEGSRDFVFNYLQDAGWKVGKVGTDSIQIDGVISLDGTVDGVDSLTNTIAGWREGSPVVKPQATKVGQATVTNPGQ